MFIAFTGSGGSGKTTIARALYHQLDERKVSYIHHVSWLSAATRNPFIKLMWAIKFWFSFNYLIYKTYLSYFWHNKEKWPRFRDRLYMAYIAPVFTYNLNKLATGDVKVLTYDTDVIVPLAENFNEDKIRNLFSKVIIPKAKQVLVVVVETPLELAVVRWHTREGRELTEKEKANQITERENRRVKSEQVLSVLGKIPSVTIVRVNGKDNPDSNVEKLLTSLDQSGFFTQNKQT